MLLQIRELARSIQGFGFAAKGRRLKISSKAALPDTFLDAAAVACDASPKLAAASGITGAEIRDTINFAAAFRSVAQELQLLGRGLEDTIAERRALAGTHSLRAYDLAKRMNAPEERELLIPHLANMERALRSVRPGPKKPKTTPAPAPTTPPTTPPPTPPADPPKKP